MAGEVQVDKEGGAHSPSNFTMYGSDVLCKVCKNDQGGKCAYFTPPNKEVYVCNRFENVDPQGISD